MHPRLPKATPSWARQRMPAAAPLHVLGHLSITGGADAAAATPQAQEGTPEPQTCEPALLTFVSLILTAMTCLRWRMISMSSSHSSMSLASCMAVFTWPGKATAHAVSRDTRVPEPSSPAALPAHAGQTQRTSPTLGPAAARGCTPQPASLSTEPGHQRAARAPAGIPPPPFPGQAPCAGVLCTAGAALSTTTQPPSCPRLRGSWRLPCPRHPAWSRAAQAACRGSELWCLS